MIKIQLPGYKAIPRVQIVNNKKHGWKKKDWHQAQDYLEEQTQIADDGHGMFELIESDNIEKARV